jgi:two-component system CheB/CheR fusion protein
VKLSTPRAQQVFNLLPSDMGRRLTDITTNLVGDFHADVNAVLQHLQVIEREMPTHDGHWYFLRIIPYRTVDNRIDGVAITFLDITSRHQAEARVRAGEERLRLLIDSATDYAIFTMTGNGVVDSWNPGAERMFGYGADEIIGQSVALLFLPEDRAAGVPQEELARAAATGRAEDERWHIRKGGARFYASGVTTRLWASGVLGFAKIARDLTVQQETETRLRDSRDRLEERVRERTVQLQAEAREHAAAKAQVTTLLQKMVTAQEAQRARMARDLHDHFGQQLTALRLTLERHRDRCSGGIEDLERSLGLVRHLDDEIDFLSWELRPLDDLGLTLALPRFVEEWSAHYGVVAHFTARGQIAGHLPAEVETAFYRIAQEALNNVLKHAHASRVDVLLERRDGATVLVVEDDGVGFDPGDAATAEKGLGLIGMSERGLLVGGSVDVESSPGSGATVYFRYPLAADEGASA